MGKKTWDREDAMRCVCGVWCVWTHINLVWESLPFFLLFCGPRRNRLQYVPRCPCTVPYSAMSACFFQSKACTFVPLPTIVDPGVECHRTRAELPMIDSQVLGPRYIYSIVGRRYMYPASRPFAGNVSMAALLPALFIEVFLIDLFLHLH